MRKRIFCAVLLSAFNPIAWAQSGHTQSAREALIEMFSGTTTAGFERHLLNETVVRIHSMTSQQQQQFQMSQAMMKGTAGQNGITWYGDGPVLASYTDSKTSNKFDVVVEKDEPGDGTEELELSFRSSGTSQKTLSSVVPRVLVSMKLENDVWKLAEIGFSMKVKLDAELIDSFSQKFAKPIPVVNVPESKAPISSETFSKPEQEAAAAVRSLLSAEQAYKTAFPTRGYTCSLAALGGRGDGSATEDRAGLIDAKLESGVLTGYRLSLLGCRGEPITGFKIMAVPEGASRYGKRAFCADESGSVRFSEDGRGITCLSENNTLK